MITISKSCLGWIPKIKARIGALGLSAGGLAGGARADGRVHDAASLCGVEPMKLKPLLLGLVLVLCSGPLAGARTRTVTKLWDDDTDGTLRKLIRISDVGDTILFSVAGGTITLTNQEGELPIGRNLTIIGPGANQLTVSGNNAHRVFNILADATVNISGLTISGGTRNGSVYDPYETVRPIGDASGGGILNNGTLVLSNCYLFQNSAQGMFPTSIQVLVGGFGGNAKGGGIFNGGNLVLINCTLNQNSAIGGQGGGVHLPPGGTGGFGAGGGIYNVGLLAATNCTLSGNVAIGGAAGIYMDYNGELANGTGGNALGGAILNVADGCNLVNCTLAGNTATGGSGTFIHGLEIPAGPGGSALGGGVYGGGVYATSVGQFLNSIFSNNVTAGSGNPDGGASGPNVFGDVTSLGHNFVSAADGSAGWLDSDKTGTSAALWDPSLGPLQDNGGPTLTMALLADSAAIDEGDDSVIDIPHTELPTLTPKLTSDQRGFPRKMGAHVDIGAYEFNPVNYKHLVEGASALLGYWRFDPIYQAASFVNGYAGTLVGNAQIGPPGSGYPFPSNPANQALQLDGVSGYVRTTLTGQITNQGTVLAWVYLTEQPEALGHIFQITSQAALGNDFDLQIETNNYLAFYTDNGSATVFRNALPLNEWHFLAATFTANSNRTIYLDGQAAAISVCGNHTVNGNPLRIGANAIFSDRNFAGKLSDVAVFSRALSDGEIASLYSAALHETSAGQEVPPDWRGTLLNGTANIGAITADHPQDRWTFTAQAGDNITVRFGSTNFEGHVELFGPDGASLGVSIGGDAAIPYPGQPTTFTVSQSGVFAVVVSGDKGGTGPYWLNFAQPSQPWTLAPVPLANGGANDGTLTLGALDRWTFTANAGENITVRFGSTDFQVRLELFGPDGASLGLVFGQDAAIPNPGQTTTFTLTKSGAYTVMVSSYSGRSTGSYHLSFAQPSQPWTLAPVPLANGGANDGTLTLGALDRWTFTANAGDNIALRFGSIDFQGRVELFGPDGTSWALAFGQDAAIPAAWGPTFTVTNSGAYTVMVSSYSGRSTGSYRLSFAQPSQPWTLAPVPLANGGANDGTLALAALDRWTFTANAGDNITVRFGSTDFQGRMELFGPDGTSLGLCLGADASIPNAAQSTYTVPQSGAYTVMVSSYSGSSAGSYRLSFAQPSRPWDAAPTPLPNGGVNNGTLTLAALDRWSFTAQAGENVFVRFASADFQGRVELFGPDGLSLALVFGQDAAIPAAWGPTFTVTMSGAYTVMISSYSGKSIGSYRMSFAQPTQPWSVPPRSLVNGNNEGTLGLGGMDLWKFTACAGDHLTVQLATAQDFVVILSLFGPDGVFVGSAANAGQVVLPLTAPKCGTYVVVAESYWGLATGAYQITASGHADNLRIWPPQIAGQQVSLVGAGGIADAVYVLSTTTNLTASPVVWTPFVTNRFDAFGVFNATAPFDLVPPRFFRLHMLGPGH